MFKALVWVGLCVGVPSVATWLTSLYFSLDEQFLVFFAVSVVAVLIALLPRLVAPPRP